MEEHRRTGFDAGGLILAEDGGGVRRVPMLAGALHYWRVRPDNWRPCLLAMKRMGLDVVQSYVPWSVHEAGAGRFEWDRELDLGRFLETVAEAGMLAVLRPGPHINAELTDFGYPARVLRSQEVQAITSRGTPAYLPAPPRSFPIPSYASQLFQRETTSWIEAAGEKIAPHLWPDGPVVALQVDNEFHMLFRTAAYDLDYHPDALAWWRDWSGDDEPPRAWNAGDAARCARWVAFKDEYAARSLGWIAEAMDAAGLAGIARFHNLPPTEPVHADLPAIEAAIGGPCGMDFYHRARDYAVVRRRALYLAGTGDPLPIAPEVGVGGPPWLPAMTAADQTSVTLGLLAAGVRGLSFYMVVDRERWYGAAIGPEGRPEEPQHGMLRELLALLRRTDWTSLRREVPVALVLSRADARFATASSVADPISPILAEFLRLGPAGAAELGLDEEAAEQRLWCAAIERALALAQVPYEIVDESAGVDRLARYQAIVRPTTGRVDRDGWQRLRSAADRGVRVVVGPQRPERDQWDQPLGAGGALPKRAGLIRPESAADLDGLAADLVAIAGPLEELWLPAGPGEVDVSLFRDAAGAPKLLFAADRSGAGAAPCALLVPAGAELRDGLTGEIWRETGGFIEIELAPWQVRILEVAAAGTND